MNKIFVLGVLAVIVLGCVFVAGCTSSSSSVDTSSSEIPAGIVKPYDFDPQTIGVLEVASVPTGAMVSVDDVYKSTTYAKILDVPIGVHEIKVEKEGYEVHYEDVTILPDTTTYVTVTLEKEV